MSRTRRFWPAAVPTGDLAQSGKARPTCPGEPWWHVPASWVLCSLALFVVLAPICWAAVRIYDLSLGVCP